MAVHACTIIARNYLPAARVLAASFARHHPDGQLTVLVIDDRGHELDLRGEGFVVRHLDEIGLEGEELRRMAASYDVMELATAVKPWLLQSLLDEGAPVALYLDPDIAVYAPLDELVRTAVSAGIVLTPHVTRPLPRDGKSTSESEVLASGMYNLGFVGVSSGAGDFLDFWKRRLRRECIVDPVHMRFVDQRWVDFVPGAFGAAIVRDPAYNVAYWNLDHRSLTACGDDYLVDGEPLRFFHFSGYRPDAPWLLSRHQGARARILLSRHPDLAKLCDAYGADLLAAGYEQERSVPYGYARLACGVVYDPVMRSLYRDALLDAESQGLGETVSGAAAEEPPNPFDPGGDQPFLDWLNAVPIERPGGRVTRYLAALYASRVDLRAAFADIDGDGFALFAEWTQHEVGQARLDPRLAIPLPEVIEAKRSFERGDRQLEPLSPGVRIAGYLRSETGVGELGRLAALTVARAGIAASFYVDSHTGSRQEHEYAASSPASYDVNLVCVNADEIGNFASRVGPRFFAGHYTIGLWAWELEDFPRRFARSFDVVDEVWGISEFTRSAIARDAPKPVFAFPLPVLEPPTTVPLRRSELGVTDGFMFLFCFDMMSIVERKNPFGLVEAFSRAFVPGEGPVLVLKAVNTTTQVPELERLKWAAAKRPDVVVVDRYLTPDDNRALMASCDCYVSLHRSEGFGLTLSEAMALGKPVIATGYSGNMDFMSDETAYLVPWTPGSVPVASDPYPHGARWAEPDLDAAAALMRLVYEHPDQAVATGARARAELLARHGVDARTSFVVERFAHARDELARRARGDRRRPGSRLGARRPRQA